MNIPVYQNLSTNCITSKILRCIIITSYGMMRKCATELGEIAHAQQAQRTFLLLCNNMTAGWIVDGWCVSTLPQPMRSHA